MLAATDRTLEDVMEDKAQVEMLALDFNSL